jgi:hypothetical protein
MSASAPASSDGMVAPAPACQSGQIAMSRLELLFGAGRKGKPAVNDRQWSAFVDREVTPRFPDGLTMFEGRGQWRDGNGAVRKESMRMLVIWYAPDARRDAEVEAIRDAYKARFAQESVMRVDGWSCVSP